MSEESKLVNGLPPHLSVDEVPEASGDVIWKHQWLYSAVPVSLGESSRLGAYLTGFCRNCGRAFSQRIPTSYNTNYNETIMGVPQYGCVDPTQNIG